MRGRRYKALKLRDKELSYFDPSHSQSHGHRRHAAMIARSECYLSMMVMRRSDARLLGSMRLRSRSVQVRRRR